MFLHCSKNIFASRTVSDQTLCGTVWRGPFQLYICPQLALKANSRPLKIAEKFSSRKNFQLHRRRLWNGGKAYRLHFLGDVLDGGGRWMKYVLEPLRSELSAEAESWREPRKRKVERRSGTRSIESTMPITVMCLTSNANIVTSLQKSIVLSLNNRSYVLYFSLEKIWFE